MPDGNDVCIVTEIILYQEELYWYQPERREIKHSFFDLGGWPFKMKKSLLFIIFIFSSFPAYHTVPVHGKARGCQVL